MARSMTGFARRETRGGFGVLVWEVRSVNHRYLDLTLRLPEELRALDAECRERIAAAVKRGKVDAILRFEPATGGAMLEIDENRARAVAAAAMRVSALPGGGGAPVDPLDILRWPGVVKEASLDVDAVGAAALALLSDALAELAAARDREGGRIAAVIVERARQIAQLVAQVRAHTGDIRERLREKLRIRIAELGVTVDAGRLEQELVIQAQRLDVAEELDRLDSHLAELSSALKRDEALGRRLDFLMQEFNREANTLGSKVQDAAVIQQVVELKVLIEQMREQVQNLE